MKTKIVSFLLAGGMLALAAWLVQGPKPAQADEVPAKYRDTVHKGLEYLVKNQHKDGHWEGDGGQHPVAMTGLVGLALLMEKETPRTGAVGYNHAKATYSANIRKAVDWLIDKSQAKRDGLIFSEHASETTRYMQGHGLATLFLAGAGQEEPDEARRKKLTDILTRAVKYIVKAQSSQGGWYNTSKVEGHDFDAIAATAIQVQSLQAAENAGVPVPPGVISKAWEYLRNALGNNEETARAQEDIRRADTAAALACGGETVDQWFKYCQAKIPVGRGIQLGRDQLTHYYYAQAIYKRGEAAAGPGGETWKAYRTALFDHLQSSQNKDGSWPAGDGIGVGPVYSAAVWCIVLQLDKGSHPSMRRLEAIFVTRGPEPRPGLTFALKSVGDPKA